MPKFRNIRLTLLLQAVVAAAMAPAQQPVAVGRGSYAAFPPTYKSRTADHGGSWATMMETREIYLDETVTGTDGNRRPIPTNDWWTDLLNHQFANALWSLPQMLKPAAEGVAVHYPTYWIENGTEVKSRTSVTVGARNFSASAAIVADWHDWDVEFDMPGRRGGNIRVTMAHGMPFTWFEFTGVAPTVAFSAVPEFFAASGEAVTDLSAASAAGYVGAKVGDDLYGIYFPAGTSLSTLDGLLVADSAPWMVVGLLRDKADLASFDRYACSVPRSTRLDWKYDEPKALLSTSWTVEATNLRRPGDAAPVMQGFLPHAYKHNVTSDVQFGDLTYLTPRGTMRMAEADGNTFTYSRRFAGIMPQSPAPLAAADASYDPARMDELMSRYAAEGAFGADTYWGGKGLIQMAMNMTFASETGNTEVYETSRRRLREVMVDWLTYTPGEDRYFFAFYPRWGSLVGYEYSFDSDMFNDHHFHYGYMLYAGALLCLNDPAFARDYGPMLRDVAKDFANWDRSDTRFPFLRNLDPWVGHSYAGGLGDGANDNGNGQESSSESMQGWGGLYLLGVALGDREMRDAGIFGWLTESAGVAEYWFDRDHIYPDRTANYDYSLYDHPYNTNITAKGIGWWTWFSGDPLWMHSIQWMPVSPCLNYLSEDLNFVRWDYETFERGTAYKWFETATRGEETLEPLANQSVGNVVLCYLERYDPARAAAIFDTAWEGNFPLARSIDTGHISYYTIHSHLTYGDPDRSVYASIPTAGASRRADGSMTYMAYNPGTAERDVTFYRDGAALRTVRVAPGRRVVCFDTEAVPAAVAIDRLGRYIAPGDTACISARVLDNYGATVDALKPEITVTGASLSADGVLSVAANAALGSTVTVMATAVGLSATRTFTVGAEPVAKTAVFTPEPRYAEAGSPLRFDVAFTDNYGESMDAAEAAWKITGPDGFESETPDFTPARPGRYEIAVTLGGATFTRSLLVTPALPDLARGCKAYSSSEENAGCLTSNATDGDPSSRWGSNHTDDEWIYVDLGRDCIITRTVVLWEAAYAAAYDIDVAPDTPGFTKDGPWTTVCDVSGLSAAGADARSFTATGRYVRIHGKRRGSAYGYSLYELEVHGIPADADATYRTGIDIDVPALIDEGSEYAFRAVAWDLGGNSTDVDAVWTASDPKAIFTGNTLRADMYGPLTVTATAGDMQASASTLVAESIKMARLEVSPAEATVILGDNLALDLRAYNQFDGMWNGDVAATATVTRVNTDANALVDSEAAEAAFDPVTGIFTATVPGTYRIDFGGMAAATVRVVAVNEANLALGKNATASSVRDGNAAVNATDGNHDTRWESDWSDGHTLTVDLEQTFNVNRVVIDWEGAYAADYEILLSTDGIAYNRVWNTTEGRGGIAEASFTPTPARYVRLQCNRRATGYGNSVYELEAYATSRYTDPSGVADVTAADADAPVDVYDTAGTLLRRGVTRTEALDGLPAGIYIVGGKPVMKPF